MDNQNKSNNNKPKKKKTPQKNKKTVRKRKPRVYKVCSSESEDENKPKYEKLEDMSVFRLYSEIKEKTKLHEENMKKYQNVIEIGTQLNKRIAEDEAKEKENEKKVIENEEKQRNFIVKDCKYLTKEDLDDRFKRDLKWIEDTFYGRRYCERHERFKKENPKSRLTSEDLMYNVSCEVFTDDQLIYLCKLFRSKFDKGKLWKYAKYYWKVLLPEYCLKIFIDCYNLKYSDAMEYLNNIPVPIERYFKITNKIDKKRRKSDVLFAPDKV